MLRCTRRFAALILLLSLAAAATCVAQTARQGNRLTMDELMEIKHPSDPVWSPDGRQVAFLWDRAGVVNLYVAASDGAGQPRAITSFADGQLENVFWSHGGQTIYFAHGGNLWQVPVSGGEPQPVWKSRTGEHDFALAPDGTRVALVRNTPGGQGADLLVRSLASGSDIRLLHDSESIQEPLWSRDGTRIACISGAKIVHHDVSPDYSGAKLIYSVEEYQPGQLVVIPSSGGKAVEVGARGRYDALAWLDAGHLVFARQSDQYKRHPASGFRDSACPSNAG